MQRYVRFVTHDPTVMGLGWNVEKIARLHFCHPAVSERRSSTSGNNHADVLYGAICLAKVWSNIYRPFPSRLVRSPSDCHSAQAYGFEFSFLELSNFVRLFESFKNDFNIGKNVIWQVFSPQRTQVFDYSCASCSRESASRFVSDAAFRLEILYFWDLEGSSAA